MLLILSLPWKLIAVIATQTVNCKLSQAEPSGTLLANAIHE